LAELLSDSKGQVGTTFTTTGWAYYLVSLQQYLETGEGAPNPDVRFDRMIRPPKHP
jgi:hypothetical protein